MKIIPSYPPYKRGITDFSEGNCSDEPIYNWLDMQSNNPILGQIDDTLTYSVTRANKSKNMKGNFIIRAA